QIALLLRLVSAVWSTQALEETMQSDLGNRFHARITRIEIRAVDGAQVEPVKRDPVPQQTRLNPPPCGRVELGAAVGDEQDDAASRVSPRVELRDGGKQRPADVGVRKPPAYTAGRDPRLHRLVVLCERHHRQWSRAEEHQRKSVVPTLADELCEQIARGTA